MSYPDFGVEQLDVLLTLVLQHEHLVVGVVTLLVRGRGEFGDLSNVLLQVLEVLHAHVTTTS